jgi:uncharacterized protein (DUF1778 family)
VERTQMDEIIRFRMKPADRRLLQAAADHRRVTVSELLREVVLEKVGRGAEFSQSTHPAQ